MHLGKQNPENQILSVIRSTHLHALECSDIGETPGRNKSDNNWISALQPANKLTE